MSIDSSIIIKDSKKESIPTFFYTIDANYYRICLISIMSFLDCADKEKKDIDIAVLCLQSELYEMLSRDIAQLPIPTGSSVNPYLIDKKELRHISLHNHHRPLESYIRIIIPRLFSTLTGPMRYIDADTIVCRVPDRHVSSQYPLHAMEHQMTFWHRFNYKYDIHLSEGYFNAGILLYDKEQYLDNYLEEKAAYFLKQYHPFLPDQDALNYACKETGFGRLDEEYNAIPRSYKGSLDDVFFIHFAGGKPRHALHNISNEIVELFHKYDMIVSDCADFSELLEIYEPQSPKKTMLPHRFKENVKHYIGTDYIELVKSIGNDRKNYSTLYIIKHFLMIKYSQLFR